MKFPLKIVLFLLIGASFAESATDLEALKDVCRTHVAPTITKDNIQILQAKGYFPRGADSVTERQKICYARKPLFSTIKGNALDISQATRDGGDAIYVIDIAADLNAKIKERTDRELKESEERRKKYEGCLKQMIAKETVTSACEEFSTKLFPLLRKRYSIMRSMLALALAAKKEPLDGMNLRHLLYTGGKENPQSKQFEIASLTENEKKLVKNEIQNVSGSLNGAKARYLSLLSQSPEFLLLKGEEITPEELLLALERSPELSRPLKEEDYVHVDGNLIEVLRSIPEDRRANYCVVAEALRENKQYRNNFNKYLLNVGTGPFLMLRSLTTGILASIFAVAPVETAMDASFAAEQLGFKLELCLRSTFIEDPKKPNSHLCNFEAVQIEAEKVNESLYYTPVSGDPASQKLPQNSSPVKN